MPDGRVTVIQVDGLGRATETIQNEQNGVVDAGEASDRDVISRTGYDAAGPVTRRTDPRGRVTALAYDLLDRLITVTEHLASGACAVAPCNVQTQYGYDRAGNRTRVVDPRGLPTQTATYDAADRQLSLTDGLNRTTSFSYDRVGNRTGVTDPRGSGFTRTESYDGRDRLTGISAQQSANLSPVSMGYDALGRRISLADGSGTTSVQYDALGRMTQLNAPNTGIVASQYNARGDRTRLTYPARARRCWTTPMLATGNFRRSNRAARRWPSMPTTRPGGSARSPGGRPTMCNWGCLAGRPRGT